IRARCQSQTTDQPCTKVGNDIAVKILEYENIELLRPHHKLHTAIVDDLVICLDLRKILRDVVKAFEEKPVRELHNVRFMDGRNLLSAIRLRVFERIAGDTCRCLLGNDLQALNDAWNHHVFKARVKVLGVLAYDHEIEFGIAAGNVRQSLYGPYV